MGDPGAERERQQQHEREEPAATEVHDMGL
jgi:hypothetical protein